MKHFRRFALVALIIAIMAMPTVAAKKTLVFGIATPALNDEGQVAIQRGVIDACNKRGIKYLIANAENNAQRQMDQFDNFILQGVDAIIAVPVDSAVLSEAVKRANDAGVLVACIDRTTSSGNLAITVQADNVNAGRQAAQYMVNLLTKKHGSPKGVVLELQGPLGTNVAQLRGKGFNDEMKKYPNIEVISKPGDFKAELAAAIAVDTLSARPELDGIYWHSDSMGMGVIPALEQIGKMKPVGHAEHIFLVGINGARAMLNYVRQGKCDVTMSQPFLDFGELAVKYLVDTIDGKPIKEGPVTDPTALWSPAYIKKASTGPMIELSTAPADLENVDNPGLWGNMKF